jgi:PDZ domain
MAKLICRKFHLTLPIATAALLTLGGSMATHAQQPPSPPTIRGMQMPEAGWLGISIDEVSAQRAQELKLPGAYGVLVAEVEADSPATKAGLKKGDVITEYDDQRVAGVLVFRRLVRETPPGRTAKMTVWRDGRSQTISAEVGKDKNATGANPFEGMLRRFRQSWAKRLWIRRRSQSGLCSGLPARISPANSANTSALPMVKVCWLQTSRAIHPPLEPGSERATSSPNSMANACAPCAVCAKSCG